ncbi:MAG: hypothetical protein ACKO99_17030 [Dolichospermum sp.]
MNAVNFSIQKIDFQILAVALICLVFTESCTPTFWDRECHMSYFGMICIEVIRTSDRAKTHIDSIFDEIVGRPPTEAELTRYIDLTVKKGWSYDQVRDELSQSAEARIFRKRIGDRKNK